MRAFFRTLLPAALVLPAFVLMSAWRARAQEWTLTSAPNLNWTTLVCSADGNTLAAVGTGEVYVSTDSGSTWNATGFHAYQVALSADGAKLLASTVNWFCISTNWGATWASNSTPVDLGNFAASADGTRLIATGGSLLYTSTDSGATWKLTSGPSKEWLGLASSADGTQLVAASHGTRSSSVYISTNSGMTWTERYSFGFGLAGGFAGAACSADGTKIAVSGAYGVFSTNAGTTWTWTASPNYYAAAVSADGSRMLFANDLYRVISGSADSGATWERVNAPDENWGAIACSADGAKVVSAAKWGGGIYIWQTTPSPKLRVTRSADNVRLSWVVPSMKFALQETSDLASAHWTNVDAAPTLNFTNLQYQVTLPTVSSNRFYRLALQ